ncbi:hypothetical protein [Bradyrhizobium japonicum]|uniref:hypothetical protein n=1 Tax=Bradyrhizobium japonicum TaxID=375 RepID=UPI001BA82454|nr:hypothetical protein [Bradyrhizobium japonicum]MBR0910806.1 hypothetical protein [Bradyrhizobium japonicum]
MSSLIPIFLSTIVAAAAWLYQKAWERIERRARLYEEIIDNLPGFADGGLDPAKINAAIASTRRLWIFAPDDVVRALHEFFDCIENHKGHDAAAAALGRLVLEMRKDTSLWNVLQTGRKSGLSPSEFRLRSARIAPGLPGYLGSSWQAPMSFDNSLPRSGAEHTAGG